MRKIKRPTAYETTCVYHGRPLVVVKYPDHLEIREKHRRRKNAVRVPYLAVFETGGGIAWLTGEQPPAPARPIPAATKAEVLAAINEALDRAEASPKHRWYNTPKQTWRAAVSWMKDDLIDAIERLYKEENLDEPTA
jgi:hypothetical protein